MVASTASPLARRPWTRQVKVSLNASSTTCTDAALPSSIAVHVTGLPNDTAVQWRTGEGEGAKRPTRSVDLQRRVSQLPRKGACCQSYRLEKSGDRLRDPPGSRLCIGKPRLRHGSSGPAAILARSSCWRAAWLTTVEFSGERSAPAAQASPSRGERTHRRGIPWRR